MENFDDLFNLLWTRMTCAMKSWYHGRQTPPTDRRKTIPLVLDMTLELYQVYSKFPTPHGGEIPSVGLLAFLLACLMPEKKCRWGAILAEESSTSDARREEEVAKVKDATRARFGKTEDTWSWYYRRSPNTLKSARLVVEEGVSVRYYCIEAEIIDIRVSSAYLPIIGNGTFLPHLRWGGECTTSWRWPLRASSILRLYVNYSFLLLLF